MDNLSLVNGNYLGFGTCCIPPAVDFDDYATPPLIFNTSMTNPVNTQLTSPYLFDYSSNFNCNSFNYADYLNFSYYLNSMSLYNSYLSGNMSLKDQSNYFSKTYNTKTDLAEINKYYNPDLGGKLAGIAEKNEYGGIGQCLASVRKDLETLGLSRGGAGSLGSAAYQSVGKLSNNENFKKVDGISQDDLKKLPAGCVIVWSNNQTGKQSSKLSDTYGHILITDGAGNGFSDHSEKLSETVHKYNGAYTVFVPTGTSKKIDKTA